MIAKILQTRAFTVAMSLVALFLLFSLAKIWVPLSSLNKENSNMTQRVDEAQNKNQVSQSQAVYFQSQAYLERELRLKLHYEKPDEQGVMIYKSGGPASASAESEPVRVEASNWDKWLSYLF